VDRSDRQTRIAQNEITFRRVNEAIEPASGAADDVSGYLCECGRLGCTKTVALRRSEYEAVRTDFDRFLLLPGHEDPEADEVVEQHGHYIVVAKVGAAREVAAADEDQSGGDQVAGR
jgi:hypothetical protein